MKRSFTSRRETIVRLALDRPAEQRGAFIAGACLGDDSLLQEVRDLLADFEAGKENPLEPRPIVKGALEENTPSGDGIPISIGHYKVEAQIGRGGMGVVFASRQEFPTRRVAVKLLRPDISSETAIGRFRREAELLARMRHPCIAQVYEAGIGDVRYDSGAVVNRPYLAMELIDGVPLSHFVANPTISRITRLEVMIRICEAVHHAHMRGIIHRDLKPTNILITRANEPRVLDFGIARVLDSDLDSLTRETLPGELLGTLPYMSPEQVRGSLGEIDARTDVYALGVTLYYLLSQRLPHDVKGLSLPEAARIIESEEPPRLGSLEADCRGDLETLTMKAMAKDPSARYSSAGQLAEDLRRFMNHEPLLAKPQGAWYLIRKLARRHRSVAAALLLSVLALTIGAGISLKEAVRARHAETAAAGARTIAEHRRHEAEVAREEALATVDFLTELLSSVDPFDLGRDVSVSTALDRAATRVEKEWKDHPRIEARVRDCIGQAYRSLGRLKQAQGHLDRAHILNESEYGADHPSTFHSLGQLALLDNDLARYDEAEDRLRFLEQAYQDLGAEYLRELLETKNRRAANHHDGDRFEESEALFREVIEGYEKHFEDEPILILRVRANLALNLKIKGRYDEAKEEYEDLLDIAYETVGEDHPKALDLKANYANLLETLGEWFEAEELYLELREITADVYGPEHANTLEVMNNLAAFYLYRRRSEEAEELFREVLTKVTPVLGQEHRYTLVAQINLASTLTDQARFEESRPLLEEALDIQRRVLGERHSDLTSTYNELGEIQLNQAEFDQAAFSFEQAASITRERLSSDHPDMAIYLTNIGTIRFLQARYKDAEAAYEEALALLTKALGEDNPRCDYIRKELVRLYRAWGKPDQTMRILEGMSSRDTDRGESKDD